MKFFVSVFFFLSVYQLLPAQSYFGIKLNTDITVDFFQSIEYQTIHPKISGGLAYKFAKYPSWWFLQMELNYVSKNLEFTWENTKTDLPGDFYTETISSKNLQFNFLSHVQLGKQNFKSGIHAGPFFSYMLWADRGFIGIVPEEDNYPMLTPWDYGITVGATFVYAIGASDIQLDVNYSMSYSSLTASLEELDFDYRNNQLVQMSLLYFFAPKKIK